MADGGAVRQEKGCPEGRGAFEVKLKSNVLARHDAHLSGRGCRARLGGPRLRALVIGVLDEERLMMLFVKHQCQQASSHTKNIVSHIIDQRAIN